MSTEYPVLSKRTQSGVVTLELWEHSSVLDLAIYRETSDEEGPVVSGVLRDLEPAEVIAAALEMLRVASYQMDLDEYDKAVAAVLDSDTHRGGGYLRDLIARPGEYKK